MSRLYRYRSVIGLAGAVLIAALSYVATTKPDYNHTGICAFSSALAGVTFMFVVPRLLDPHSRRRWLGIAGLAITGVAFVWPTFANGWALAILALATILGTRVLAVEDLARVHTGYGNPDPMVRRGTVHEYRIETDDGRGVPPA